MRIKLFLLCCLLLLASTLLSCTDETPIVENAELIEVSIGLNEIHDGYNKILLQDSILMDILYRVDTKNIGNFLTQSMTSFSRIYISGNGDNMKYHQVLISCDDLSQLGSPDVIEYIYDGERCKNIVNGEVVATSNTHLTKEKLLQFSSGEWKKDDVKEIYKVISGIHSQYTVVLSDAHFDKYSHEEGDGGNLPQELLTRTYTATINSETGMIEHASQHDVVSTTIFGEVVQYNRYTDYSYQFPETNTN